jgi:ligand-binding sensor domain-containing protein
MEKRSEQSKKDINNLCKKKVNVDNLLSLLSMSGSQYSNCNDDLKGFIIMRVDNDGENNIWLGTKAGLQRKCKEVDFSKYILPDNTTINVV